MNIINNKKKPITLAKEVKIATICVQNHKKSISPMVIIVARSQGMNEVSSFTEDTCKAAQLVIAEHGNYYLLTSLLIVYQWRQRILYVHSTNS